MRVLGVALLIMMLSGCSNMAVQWETVDGHAPNLSFMKHAASYQIRIVNADPDADWHDMVADIDGCAATLDGAPLRSGQPMAAEPTTIEAGDIIQAAAGCTITIVHAPTNQLYDTWTFG